MSGELIRAAPQRHRCLTPESGREGDVWRCECGKRWTCIDHTTRVGNMVHCRAHWIRRFWPWPR